MQCIPSASSAVHTLSGITLASTLAVSCAPAAKANQYCDLDISLFGMPGCNPYALDHFVENPVSSQDRRAHNCEFSYFWSQDTFTISCQFGLTPPLRPKDQVHLCLTDQSACNAWSSQLAFHHPRG